MPPPHPPPASSSTATTSDPSTSNPLTIPTTMTKLPPQTMLPDSRISRNYLPRLIVYHQTHWHGPHYISMLPLSRGGRRTTHVVLAAIHLNEVPGDITLNDDPWDDSKHFRVWQEAKMLQKEGLKVMGMLGGAAKGTFTRLDTEDEGEFYDFYEPLCQMIASSKLDGLDLDVEEDMSLKGIVRLIDQLRRDYGVEFIITLAPVATALMGPEYKHLSGFDYEALEVMRGNEIAWYNTQFYNGWGFVEDAQYWDAIMARGWKPEKVVVGVLTNPESGRGWVVDDVLRSTLLDIRKRYPNIGGVMGWEYFNSITVAQPYGWPWSWADLLTEVLHPPEEAENGNNVIDPTS